MTEISEKQLQANRENAKLGGVKTEEGKAVSKHNALKHGLLSQEVLLSEESEEELVALGKRMRAELAPATELEVILVDRIVANTWRLRRMMRVEREMIEDDKNTASISPFRGSDKTLGGALGYEFGNRDKYDKYLRYEVSVERGIYKALHELQRLQAIRKGKDVALPHAVDVDVSGDVKNGFVS